MQNSVKPTYSIILMRDDCDVSAFRLHSFWLKMLIFFLIILVAACIIGAYGTFYYKNRFEVTYAERRELQRSLGDIKIKMESLSNEELVGRFTGVGSAASTNYAVNSVLIPGTGAAYGGGNPSAPTASSESGTVAPTQEDLVTLLNQIGPVEAAGVENSEDTESKMERHPVKITNLKTTFEGDDRIRTAYDLSNQQHGLTLVGRCSIALITREGAIVDITPSARGVLSFQIARFRKMDILSKIPPSISKEDIVKVQISAQANDLPLYYRQFPMAVN